MNSGSGFEGGDENPTVSRRRLLQTSAVGLATVSTGPGVVSASNRGASSDDVTHHEFEYVQTHGSTGGVTGKSGSHSSAGPGILRSKQNLDGIRVNRSSAETATGPIRRQAGSYEIRCDWQLEGTRTDGLNMLARAGLYHGPTREKPVQSVLLSSASRADPSFQTSGTIRLETHLSEDVGTALSLELLLFTPPDISEPQEGDFELWVQHPNCEDEAEEWRYSFYEDRFDKADILCAFPRWVEVRPA